MRHVFYILLMNNNVVIFFYSGGGPVPKTLSAVAEIVLRILGENNATISGVGDCQDEELCSILLKLITFSFPIML